MSPIMKVKGAGGGEPLALGTFWKIAIKIVHFRGSLAKPLVITYTGIVFEWHNDTKDLSFAACILKSACTSRQK